MTCFSPKLAARLAPEFWAEAGGCGEVLQIKKDSRMIGEFLVLIYFAEPERFARMHWVKLKGVRLEKHL